MSNPEASRATEDEMYEAVDKLQPLDNRDREIRGSLVLHAGDIDPTETDVEGTDPKTGDWIGITKYRPNHLFANDVDMGMTYASIQRERPNGNTVKVYAKYQEGTPDEIPTPIKKGLFDRIFDKMALAYGIEYPRTRLKVVRTVKLPDGTEKEQTRESFDPTITRDTIKKAAEKLEPASEKAKANKAA